MHWSRVRASDLVLCDADDPATMDRPDAPDRSYPALRLLLSGGAPISPDLVRRIGRRSGDHLGYEAAQRSQQRRRLPARPRWPLHHRPPRCLLGLHLDGQVLPE